MDLGGRDSYLEDAALLAAADAGRGGIIVEDRKELGRDCGSSVRSVIMLKIRGGKLYGSRT